MKKNLIDMVESCDFVPATALIPRGWDSWFWEAISENAPFSWGDNNRSLVDFQDFLNHVAPIVMEDFETSSTRMKKSIRDWLDRMNDWAEEAKHGPVYIDLEN